MKTPLACLLALSAGLGMSFAAPADDSGQGDSPLVVMDPFETTVMRADQVDVPAAIVKMVEPRYPRECAMKGIMGRVEIVAVIDSNGRIRDPEVVRADNKAFASAALDAVNRWLFEPAEKDGLPVAVRVSIPVRFVVPELLAQG